VSHSASSCGWLKVGDDSTPLSEVGVIAAQATVLSPLSIPLLYHSTFGFDFTFVPLENVGAAIAAFDAAGYAVRREDSPPPDQDTDWPSG